MRNLRDIGALPFARLLDRAGLLRHIDWHERIEVNGVSVTIPLRGGTGLAYRSDNEPWMSALLRRLCALRGGAFVDAGVNLGQTLVKLKTLDPARRYVGFEPNPLCVGYAETLIAANGFADCSVIAAGLGDDNGTAELFMTDDTDGNATMLTGFRPGADPPMRRHAAVMRLDDIAPGLALSGAAIFKIDVEGFELDVLRGARGWLARTRPFVICEVLPVYDPAAPQGARRLARQQQIESMMAEMNYAIARIDHEGGTPRFIDGIGIHSNLKWCDYLFCPAERVKAL